MLSNYVVQSAIYFLYQYVSINFDVSHLEHNLIKWLIFPLLVKNVFFLQMGYCYLLVSLLLLPKPITSQFSSNFVPNYEKALQLSLLFYDAQRSGHLPETHRVPWRGDSALEDRGTRGEDLTGGYYDASDFVKFSFTMAFTTTILSWGMLSFKDGYSKTGRVLPTVLFSLPKLFV